MSGQTITGTELADSLLGTDSAHSISGVEVADTLFGLGGNDTLSGGFGLACCARPAPGSPAAARGLRRVALGPRGACGSTSSFPPAPADAVPRDAGPYKQIINSLQKHSGPIVLRGVYFETYERDKKSARKGAMSKAPPVIYPAESPHGGILT